MVACWGIVAGWMTAKTGFTSWIVARAISCCCALIETGSDFGLHDDELGRVIGVQIGEISYYSTGKASYTGLYENVSRTVNAKIL